MPTRQLRTIVGGVAISLLCAANVRAQSIRFVQINAADPQSPQPVVAVTYTSAQTAGNLNVVVVGWSDVTTQVLSVTDSKGNAYARAIGTTRANLGVQCIYYAANISAASGGTNTVTVAFSAAAVYPDVRIVEYRGISTTDPLDVVGGAQGSGTSANSGAIATTNANDLLVGASYVQTHNTGSGSGYTSRIITYPDGDIVEDRVVTAKGTYGATAPMTSGAWVMQMVAFKATGSGGGTTPTISSLSPTSGPVGTSVTINGSNFGTTQGTVKFNGTTATPSSWTASTIVVPVPSGAATGNVVVTVGGAASNGVAFTVVTTTPTITSVSPTSGAVGTSVTITGTNFGTAQDTVTFNGTPAVPATWTATSIVAPVPVGATTGNVVVTVGGTASNGVAFALAPAITSLSPASGIVGAQVTIAGSNFGAMQGTVTFNGTTAPPSSWTAGNIVVPVPAGATTGNVVVTMSGGLASNGMPFTVQPSITSLSPTSGPVGTQVTIAGWGFGTTRGASTVTFNGATATPSTWSATSIVVPVPTGATTGNVIVTVGGVASNGVSFAVTAPPPTSLGFVQVNAITPQSPQARVALAYTGGQTAGDLNVVVVGWNDTTSQVTSVTDSRGNPYSKAVGPTIAQGIGTQSIYYAANILSASAGSNTVTVTFSASAAYPDVRIVEYRGVDPTVPVDVVAAGFGSGATSDSGVVPTTTANDLLVGASYVLTHNTGAGVGFTSRVITDPDGDIVEDRIVTAAGNYGASAPMTSGGWVMQMVAFRAISSMPDTTPPSVPGNLQPTVVSASEIDLVWTASTDDVGVKGYYVYRDTLQIATTTSPAFKNLGLAASRSYTFTVAAFDASGNTSNQSPAVIATTASPPPPDTQPPTIPGSVVAVAASTSQINISWAASSDDTGVAGYRVYRSAVSIGTTSTRAFSDTGLAASTTYYYSVSAYDAAGNDSGPSATSSAATLTTPPGPAYPVKLSANRRYLVDQNNVPFLITGDSPHDIVGNITEADAEFYLANRQAAGYNAIWMNLLCNWGTNCPPDGTTIDGLAPFTVPGDLSNPNEAYFKHIDNLLRLAANHGITVFLDPAETKGWLDVLRSNGVAKSRAYGLYVGTRYKTFDNIIWISGNDFQTWSSSGDDAVASAVALGIADVDSRHIQTVELNYNLSASLDDPTWAPIVSLDAAYTYYPTYAEVLQEYNRGTMPVFMVEANYENENNGTPQVLRKQEYWTLLSGATGQLYGNATTWPFAAGWKTNLDGPGSVQFGYARSLFESRRWWTLVPDQSHTVVTAGYGTYSSASTSSADILTNDYATTARASDGSFVMSYLPTRRTVTVDMSSLSGPSIARWYDPTNGTFSTIAGGPFANAGSIQFTPPAANAEGAGDWVLVIEVQ